MLVSEWPQTFVGGKGHHQRHTVKSLIDEQDNRVDPDDCSYLGHESVHSGEIMGMHGQLCIVRQILTQTDQPFRA